ncbi:hypothetical protein BJF95_13500 [Rhizobium oryziradicis]|uniref:Uncharacterized protein n=1 Tax=Rhizobium oryziradicis TaxID=1867956 RepID=A0A1Q8ZKQ8_9HYPH|nr:hypothetical protein BJF95_13500 [Rhizobium oryziradicis]
MVLLENVVEIFDLSDPDPTPAVGKFQDDVHRLKPGEIGTALVDNDAVRHPFVLIVFLQKRRAATRSRRLAISGANLTTHRFNVARSA